MAIDVIKSPHVIGMAGSFGSGCSYVAKNFFAGNEYSFLSLSDALKKGFMDKTGCDPLKVDRRVLQDFGDEIRRENGSGYFAEKVLESIEILVKSDPLKNYIVDCFKNPAEIKVFRERFRNFFLFGIYADIDVRWERVKKKYDLNQKSFLEDDENDKGDNNKPFGQRVRDCFYDSDIVLTNNINFRGENIDYKQFESKIGKYLELIKKPLQMQQPVHQDETIMTMAYAASMRSSCLKRKVGAVIIDKSGNVISSGYNEVPPLEDPCIAHSGGCYRDKSREELKLELKSKFPDTNSDIERICDIVKDKYKILDLCRALHAEENAILNLIINGNVTSIKDCTLYTTTYPCNLCANKISKIGIKRIIYLEPYPQQEAKETLTKSDVESKFFEGITYKAYFRIYGEEK